MRLNKSAYNALNPETRARLERLSGEKIEIATDKDFDTRRKRRVAEKLKNDRRRQNFRTRGLDRAERQRLEARRSRRENDYLTDLRAKYESTGAKSSFIRVIPLRVRIMAGDILSDPSGLAAKIYLRRCYNRTIARKLLEAVGDPTSTKARKIIALGLCLFALSEDTKKSGRWRRIVRGFPQLALLGLLRDPFTGRRPALSSLRGLRKENDQGYLDTLEAAEILYSQQLPISQVADFEALGEHALNRYWLIRDAIAPLDRAELEAAAAAAPLACEFIEAGAVVMPPLPAAPQLATSDRGS